MLRFLWSVVFFFVFRNWEGSQFVRTHLLRFLWWKTWLVLKCRNSESTILGGWIGALFTFLLFAFENIFQGERGKILVVGIIHHSFVTAFAIVAPAGGSNNGALFPFRDPAQLFLSELDIYQCFIFSLQRTLSLLEVRSNKIFPKNSKRVRLGSLLLPKMIVFFEITIFNLRMNNLVIITMTKPYSLIPLNILLS